MWHRSASGGSADTVPIDVDQREFAVGFCHVQFVKDDVLRSIQSIVEFRSFEFGFGMTEERTTFVERHFPHELVQYLGGVIRFAARTTRHRKRRHGGWLVLPLILDFADFVDLLNDLREDAGDEDRDESRM